MDEDDPNSFTRNKIKHRWLSALAGGVVEAPAETLGVTRVKAAA
jgi:hypothetical protein